MSGPSPSGIPKKGVVKLRGTIVSLAAGIFTYLLPFFVLPQFNLAKRFASEKLFHDDPIIQGVPSPNLASLDLTNKSSELTLENFLGNRESGSPEDQVLAEECLRKALRDERGASQQTVAYLLALYGQFRLDGGDWRLAIEKLEEANKKFPGDPHVQSLLLRSYEAASLRLQDSSSPWPVEIQEQIRLFSRKAEELRDKLHYNYPRCTDCHSAPVERGVAKLTELSAEKLRLGTGVDVTLSHRALLPYGEGYDTGMHEKLLTIPIHEASSSVGHFILNGRQPSLLSFLISSEINGTHIRRSTLNYDRRLIPKRL